MNDISTIAVEDSSLIFFSRNEPGCILLKSGKHALGRELRDERSIKESERFILVCVWTYSFSQSFVYLC